MATDLWNPLRKSIINDITEKQQENKNALNEIANEVRRAKIAGSSISIIGGMIALLGFVLLYSMITFGGIVVSIVGTIIALRGAFISVTASFGKFWRQKKIVKSCTKEILAIDKQLWEVVKKLAEKCNKKVSKNDRLPIEDISAIAKNVIRAITYFGIFTAGGIRVTRSGGLIATQSIRIASTAFRAIGIVGIVTSVLVLPMDVFELGVNTYGLYTNRDSKSVSHLKDIIEKLKKHQEGVEKELKEREHEVIAAQTPVSVEEDHDIRQDMTEEHLLLI